MMVKYGTKRNTAQGNVLTCVNGRGRTHDGLTLGQEGYIIHNR